MRKTLVVAAREYQAAVRTKSFVISLFIMPLMMGGGILANYLLKDQADIQEKPFAVIDRTPDQGFLHTLAIKAQARNEKEIYSAPNHKQVKPVFTIEAVEPSTEDSQSILQQRFALSERVRKKELIGFLEISPKGMKGDASPNSPALVVPDALLKYRIECRYQTNSPTYLDFSQWARMILDESAKQRRFVSLNPQLSQNDLKIVLEPVSLQTKGLSTKNAAGQIEEAQDEQPIASFGVPFGFIMLMFMLTLLGATPLMQGVVEEKMQRIAEVLLGSVRPFELMMGKLLGMVGVSLTLGGVYLSGAYWSAHRYGFAQYLPVEMLLWFGIYLSMAVLMYGSLFIAVGAACTDLRETQTMLWPVMLLICIPMFVWFTIVREPNSTFSTCISFFPFATPILMMGRLAVPPGIAWWQPPLGVVLVLVTTLLCVYAAGRIFRVGILMQGKGAQLGDLVKWVFRG
jgi:ABC-2 type transport system permease protein